MLLPLDGRNIAYDLIGLDTAPVVCMTHSLASDSGMWAEQVPGLLGKGFRVLRIDMRGHGGSDPVSGDYTMPQLAGDVALVLDTLAIPRVHFIGLSIGGMLGQAFAIEHGNRLLSAMWCDTMPAAPPGAADAWGPRMQTVQQANSLAPLADPTMERWLTDAVNMMLNYGVAMSRKKSIIAPVSTAKPTVFDLSPTVVKDIVNELFCRENWHIL